MSCSESSSSAQSRFATGGGTRQQLSAENGICGGGQGIGIGRNGPGPGDGRRSFRQPPTSINQPTPACPAAQHK
jgi:hypothetical protein